MFLINKPDTLSQVYNTKLLQNEIKLKYTGFIYKQKDVNNHGSLKIRNLVLMCSVNKNQLLLLRLHQLCQQG